MGGVVGGALSIGGALIGAKSQKKAASAQSSAASAGIKAEQAGLAEQLAFQREALAQEKQMFEQSLALGQPYRSAGERALTEYQDLLYGRAPAQAPKLEQFLAAGSSATPLDDKAAYDAALTKFNAQLPAQIKLTEYRKIKDPAIKAKYTRVVGAGYSLKEQPDYMKEAPKQEDFKIAPQYDQAAYQTALDAFTARQNDPNALSQNQQLEADRVGALIKSPGYQFQMDEGTKALERSASARSGALSGAQSKALARFGQGLASTSYQSFMDRLAGLSGQGAAAAGAGANAAMQAGAQQAGILGNMGNASMASAGNVGSLLSQQGAAKASGYLGQASAMNSGFNNAASMIGAFGGGSNTNLYGGGSGTYGNLGQINWYK